MRATLLTHSSAVPTKSRLQLRKFADKLSKDELLAVTTAFNRARGHFHGLNIDRFRDSLLREAFVGIPEYLVQRIFHVWDTSGGGEISLSEFIAGVAAAAKGSRDDHLEMVFRMLSSGGDDKIVSRSELSRFFECVATSSGCVAIEKGKTIATARSWTAGELLHVLFGYSVSRTLTLQTSLAVLGSKSSFDVLKFIDWIPNLATRVLKVNDVVLPTPTTSQNLTQFKLFTTRDGLSTKQRDYLRVELRNILLNLSADTPTLTASSIFDRFRNELADDSLLDTIGNTWQAISTVKRMKSPYTNDVREELKLFVLGLCCVHASSVHQIYRLLFELFDEDSCGQIGVDQLSAFLHLTTGLTPIDCEREARITIQRRGRSQSSLSSPPPSPGRSSTLNTVSPQVLTLTQFVEVAQQHPGFSIPEVETALLLFHLKRYSSNYQCGISPTITNHDRVLLPHLLDSYFSEQNSQSTAFCLLGTNEWAEMIKETLTWQQNSSAYTNAQIMNEEVIELLSGHVMIPLPVWILVSYWHGINSSTTLSLDQHDYPVNWVSSIKHNQDGHNSMRGFWIRISLRLTSCDGFERTVTFPQVIVFDQCTLQSVIDAVLFQKSWCGHGKDASSKVTTICQCQVLIADRNAAGEIKTVLQQEDPTILPQDQLASPLSSILPVVSPSWVSKNAVDHGKLAFEFLFSVVEVEEKEERRELESRSTEVLLDVGRANSRSSLQQIARRSDKTPRGMTNLGNTCFMNAVLQCLSATPMLKTHIIQHEDFSSATLRIKAIEPVKKSLLEILGELFREMSRSKQEAENIISPTDMWTAFAALSSHMSDGSQQDAQEFFVCLLGHMVNALKRNPKQNGESTILSPRSYAFLANLFPPKATASREVGDNVLTENKELQFCMEDSNGRHDRLVATEWWVSHLVNEPSVINALFSGQFKSTLACDHCHHQSARFEPFSSLQLPLEECTTKASDQKHLVVIVHFAESLRSLTVERGRVRVVVQVEEHSTLADVLAQLPISQPKSSPPRYIIGGLDEFTIKNLLVTDRVEDQIEDKTPASALPNPTRAFEVFNIASNGDDTAAPTRGNTQIHLRFVHRHTFLVPFYCTTPTRQALCGSPFVCSSTLGALTGQALHQMVFHRFLLGRSAQFRARSSSVCMSKPQTDSLPHHYAPPFTLRRVRDDGITCSRCYWSTGCPGCQIPPTTTAAELLDLENCETIAIDWDLQLHPQDESAFWWLQSYPTRDHKSYIHYRRTQTHSLQQSLLSLCSTEHLDASCSHCHHRASTLTPHTKQLALWSLPPLLVLQLKRFELSTNNGNYQWTKLSHNVDFPIHGLDVRNLLAPIDGAHDDSEPCTAHCSAHALDARVRRGIDFLQNELNIPLSSASRSCTTYDLYAVVNHSGRGISSGHYTAHFKRPDETCWWLADDATVTPLNEDELSPSTTAYLLYYVRQDIATGVTELSDLFPTQGYM